MKAFVTGATGFVGSHVAQALEVAGAELRLLARSTSPTKPISTLKNSEIVTGDLRDASTYKQALRGCEAVFHVAADYRLWTRNAADAMEMYRSNVEGTRGLIDAARQAGVKRIVYCSSVATMGFRSDGSVVDEETPVTLEEMIGHYKRSKFVAEQVALEAGKKGDDVVIVNPSAPVGEQDVKPTPTGRIIVDFLKKKFPAYVDTGLNVVDVREVARGHVLAYERGKPGERYILGGENLTLKQILDKLSATTGIPAPKVKLPYVFALAAGVFDTVFTGQLRGKEPRVTIDAVRMGRKKMWVRSSKAERELGYKVVPVEDALRRACEWFKTNGYV
ncbi:MAG TPA: hopanoid-associated sugar epimerase [Candidatus Binatia bacterium]